MKTALTTLLLISLLPACSADYASIPCRADDNCPTGYVCLNASVCAPGSALEARQEPDAGLHREAPLAGDAGDSRESLSIDAGRREGLPDTSPPVPDSRVTPPDAKPPISDTLTPGDACYTTATEPGTMGGACKYDADCCNGWCSTLGGVRTCECGGSFYPCTTGKPCCSGMCGSDGYCVWP